MLAEGKMHQLHCTEHFHLPEKKPAGIFYVRKTEHTVRACSYGETITKEDKVSS